MNSSYEKAARFYKVIVVLLGMICLSVGVVSAEPWISNRFAQNCAGCHAAGRLNKPAIGRRCTLSCQGCHVNPQGGGLRNSYGKWNSQRWLRSFQSEFFRGEKTPAPLIKQPYASRVKTLGEGKALDAKNKKAPLHKAISQTHPPMRYYDKYSWSEWKHDLTKESDFLATIPMDDPYREERTMFTDVGADIRYFQGTWKSDSNGSTQEIQLDGLMAIDIGVRIRPTKFHQFSFVLEPRIEDAANTYLIDSIDSQSGYLKSAYALVDDLAYNSFVQFGNFRPLFGNMNVSHISLAQELSGFGQRPTFRTLSLGTAPNIPFLIVNYVISSNAHGTSSDTSVGNEDDGVVVTLGGRWVTYGLSTKFSYWSTSRDGQGAVGGEKRKWDMYSFTAGGVLGPLILNLESVRIERDKTQSSGSDAGNVNTIESKIRLWREFYLTSSYAMSNTASDLSRGDATEMTYGLKVFPIAGVELEVLASTRDEKFTDTNIKKKIDLTAIQLHAFF